MAVFFVWVAACVWSVGVCYRMGYERDADTLAYILGFPDWIFWGVIAPWTTCTVICFLMSYFVIRDDDLGEEQAEEALDQGTATAAETEHA